MKCRPTLQFVTLIVPILVWAVSGFFTESFAAAAPLIDAFRNAVPVCKAEQWAKEFDGKEFLIVGLFRQTPHGGVFYGADCHHQLVKLVGSKDYFEDETAGHTLTTLIRSDRTKPVDVVYLARFQIVQGLLCNEVMCFSYKLDIDRLVAARAVDNGTAHHRQ
jgi:hypothetical protein